MHEQVTVRQLFYTSCRSGLGFSAGFQFNAASPGIDAALMAEVEELCRYRPPPSAPQAPTGEALARVPVSLSFSFLRHGGAAISRSVYVGTDYSGRPGNFFAHTLLPDRLEADLAGRLPIELWRSPVWVERESPVIDLPPLHHLDPGDPSRQRAASFLRAEGRIDRLPALLTAALEALAPDGRQVILVAESTEVLASWIAAACYCLPYAVAIRLSFTTYTLRPCDAPQRIVGATPDADFDIPPAALHERYRVFDFCGRLSSPPASGSYGRTAMHLWQAGPPEIFVAFDFFAGRAGVDGKPAELAGALALFALIRDRSPDKATLKEAARWAGARGASLPEEAWSQLARGLEGRHDFLSLGEMASLARAASGLSRPLAARFARPYLARLLEELQASEADPELWSAGPEAWVPGPLPEDVKVWLAERMEPCLAGIGDVRSAAVALTLIAGPDIRPSDEALRRLGVEVLGPAVLTGPDESIERARATPAGARAWKGALDSLERMGRLESFSTLVERLTGPRRRWVEDADPQTFPRLSAAALIAGARSRPDRRLEVLDRLLPAAEPGPGAPGPGVDELISLLWAGAPPSPEEGVGLLQVLPHDLGGPSVPHLLMSALAAAPRVDGHAVRLATSLAGHPCSDFLAPEHRALLEALRQGERFRRGRPDQPATERATRLLAGADALPDAVHHWLIRGLCGWLIGVAPTAHADVLRPLWPPGGRATQQTYPTEMVNLLADRESCGPAEAARVFVAWQHLERGYGSGDASLLESRLPQALRKWSKERLDEVAVALIPIDASWVPVWGRWRDRHLPASVLGRLRRRLERADPHRGLPSGR